MNFDMAAEWLIWKVSKWSRWLPEKMWLLHQRERKAKRRGVAGIFYVFKIAGALADELASLAEVKRVAEKTCANVRTMGVALTPCIVPELGKAFFFPGEKMKWKSAWVFMENPVSEEGTCKKRMKSFSK